MEYVSGENLKSMIRMTKQMSVETALDIGQQVCQGLAEAHRLGVVHRDLKPQNIMIDEDGNVRILDFGIARSLETKGATTPGMMIGTPEYMSPEQVDGGEVDQRTDIYSLGLLLYEMLTGRPPFEGENSLNVIYKQKHEAPRDLRSLLEGRADEGISADKKMQRIPLVIGQVYTLLQRNLPLNSDFAARAKAVKKYQKLAEIWKDADQDLTEVQQVRRRLAALKG